MTYGQIYRKYAEPKILFMMTGTLIFEGPNSPSTFKSGPEKRRKRKRRVGVWEGQRRMGPG